jgi:hypothetical protein
VTWSLTLRWNKGMGFLSILGHRLTGHPSMARR